MRKILIIDDDMDMCRLLSHFLQRKGFEATTAYSGNKGLAAFRENRFDLVLCDFRLGDKDGREILQEIKKEQPAIPVIIITGYSDIKMAVEVMRHGAFDYITKPLIPEEVISLINRALAAPVAHAVQDQPGSRDSGISGKKGDASAEFLAGISQRSSEADKQIAIVAPTNYSVIIYGESGTGKEVIAKAIHEKSQRKSKPFVAVDCGTLSRELAASELFGHIKGSFTGALADKEGMFEAAEGGTLFLDEVANLPLDVQVTLLRVLQERKFRRVGSPKDNTADVRVIVASNENLQEACRKGKFREDLYHRFNEFSLSLPPLRERKEDIPRFASFFLEKAGAELNKKLDGFEEEVMQLFLGYHWPGNLREFRNVIRRAALLTPAGLVSANTLPWEIIGSNTEAASAETETPSSETEAQTKQPLVTDLKDAASQAEYEAIMHVLKQVKYNKTRAAEILKIDRKTLYNKLRNYEEASQLKE